MAQQVIMAVAQTDRDGTLMRPVISVHGSIMAAQQHLWEHTILELNKVLDDDEKVEGIDDDRIVAQVNITGTTTVDIDLDDRQVCATIKVVI